MYIPHEHCYIQYYVLFQTSMLAVLVCIHFLNPQCWHDEDDIIHWEMIHEELTILGFYYLLNSSTQNFVFRVADRSVNF